jgi:tRNA-5-taurinomethyluridine 2-sulfurtransferase
MRNWTDDSANTPCRSETDWQDVQDVCRHLSIPCERVRPLHSALTQIDLSREYWTEVFQPALDMYFTGSTPNPDIACNREIKFGKLFDRLNTRHSHQMWWLATGSASLSVTDIGHYARSAINSRTGKSVLLRSKDTNKDQTFYLSQISQRSLSRSLFPLSNLTKPEIRKLAKSYLPAHIADKPESQGLCFVEPSMGRHFSTFLKDYLPAPQKASITLENGKVVGEHPSIWLATIGARSRLNFKESQRLNPGGQWYIASKSISPPSYVIVPGQDHPRLFSRSLIAKDWRWIDENEMMTWDGLVAQIRHRQEPIGCTLQRQDANKIKVNFKSEKGVYGVTPGQAIAVWLEERCLGGGIIESAD